MKLQKKHSFWLGLNYAILLISSFVTLKINLINFGNELFGIWILFTSLWGIGSVLDFGLGISITKYIAQNYDQNKEKIAVLISTSSLFFIVIGSMLFLMISQVGELFYLRNSEIINDTYSKMSTDVFYILGVSFLMQYLSLFFKSIFEGFNEFIITSKISIGSTFLILFSTTAVWLSNLDLRTLAICYLITFLLILIIYCVFYYKKYSIYKISLTLINLQSVKEIFTFSFSVQLTTIIGQGIDPIIKYFISSSYSITLVPAYEIGRKISTSITGLFHSSFRNLLPIASYNSSIDTQKIYLLSEISKISRYSIVYISFTFGVLLWFFPTLIELWFNLKEAAIIFLLLSMAESINAYGYSLYIFFFAIGKVYINLVVQLINLLVYSSVLIISLDVFGSVFGFIGYFLSTLIANILMFLFVSKKYDIKLKTIVKEFNFIDFAILLSGISIACILVYFNYDYALYILLTLAVFTLGAFSKKYLYYFNNIKNILLK